jgi:ketosteroid isomerase-like protein
VSGKKEIESAFGQMLAAGIGSASLTTVEVWGNEALVAEEGTYTLMDKAGKEIDKGKYIVLWKMEDGKWKLFRDCFNSDLPPAPMPAK